MTKDDSLIAKVGVRISKVRETYVGVKHLCRRADISQKSKDHAVVDLILV